MIHDHATRDAAVTDYQTSGDTLAEVARRHGVSRSALAKWASPPDRAARIYDQSDDQYTGGWERVGLIQRPLMPEQRSA